MILNKNFVFEVIELTHIPSIIERQEQEKICLSNLILEYFRDSLLTTSLEIICTSNAVNDQLLAGMPHFYLILYLSPIISKDNIEFVKDIMNNKINGLLCVLHRIGYQTSLLSTKADIAKIIPFGLVGNKEVCLVSSTTVRTNYQLQKIDIPTTYDNLIAMMTTAIPDSLFSIYFSMEENRTNVGFCINVLSKTEFLARLIYMSFVEGMGNNYNPKSSTVILSDSLDYWNLCRTSYNLLSYKEVSKILQLPFGTFSGISITPQQRKLPIFESNIINGKGINIGTVIGSGNDKRLTLPLQVGCSKQIPKSAQKSVCFQCFYVTGF